MDHTQTRPSDKFFYHSWKREVKKEVIFLIPSLSPVISWPNSQPEQEDSKQLRSDLKAEAPGQGQAWLQWCGSSERGLKKSLVLERCQSQLGTDQDFRSQVWVSASKSPCFAWSPHFFISPADQVRTIWVLDQSENAQEAEKTSHHLTKNKNSFVAPRETPQDLFLITAFFYQQP